MLYCVYMVFILLFCNFTTTIVNVQSMYIEWKESSMNYYTRRFIINLHLVSVCSLSSLHIDVPKFTEHLHGKLATIFGQKIQHTSRAKEKPCAQKRTPKKGKGANQKEIDRRTQKCNDRMSKYTQIGYDRSMATVEGKQGERERSDKNNKCRTKASDELNVEAFLAACLCGIVVVQFKRNAFRCARQLDTRAVETRLTDFDYDRAIKIADLKSNLTQMALCWYGERIYLCFLMFSHCFLVIGSNGTTTYL